MIRKFLKIYFFVFLLLSDSLMFADDDPVGGMEDETGWTGRSVDGAPVNAWVICMTVVAIAFGFYYFQNKEKVSSNQTN